MTILVSGLLVEIVYIISRPKVLSIECAYEINSLVLAVLGLRDCSGFSLVVVQDLLITAASLITEHEL